MSKATNYNGKGLNIILSITNLKEANGIRSTGNIAEECDVCVIGAGAAGCHLASKIANTGLHVVVLEAGDMTTKTPEEIGFNAVFAADLYPGAITGRSFGLGGSTARWGGLLAPHSQYDERPANTTTGVSENEMETWKHIVKVVNERQSSVLKQLGYTYSKSFLDFPKQYLGDVGEHLAREGINICGSIYLPFRRKNLFNLLENSLREHDKIRVYTNAIARNWYFNSQDGKSRAKNVLAVSKNGHSVRIEAREYVVAAGAIESARTLLEMQESMLPKASLSCLIGKGLSDHLSIPIAEVNTSDNSRIIRQFAPRFSGPWMRGFRFLQSTDHTDSPRYFTHFVFDNQDDGFLLAKKVLTTLQAKQWPNVGLSEFIGGSKGLINLAWSRYLKSRLFIRDDTKIRLQLDVEQLSSNANRISLGDSFDEYGRRVTIIDWRITNADHDRISRIAKRFISKWNNASEILPTLTPKEIADSSEKPHDAYHPVGVCRMGTSVNDVVDLKLKVNGLENLYIASTAVLPTAGTANPTFTLLCLTDSLSDDIVAKFR